MKSLLIALVLTLSGLAVGQPPQHDREAFTCSVKEIWKGEPPHSIDSEIYELLALQCENAKMSAETVALRRELAALKRRIQKLETLLKAKEVTPEKPCTAKDNSGCILPASAAPADTFIFDMPSDNQVFPHDIQFTNEQKWKIRCLFGEPRFETKDNTLSCVTKLGPR